MLKIKILNSPDSEILGERETFKNLISIGNQIGDLIIRDPDIVDYHLSFECNPDGLILHLNKDISHFHLNGKKTSGIISINNSDQIKIGATTFEIIDFSHTPKYSRKEQLETAIQKLIAQDAPVLEVLAKFEERMES